MNAKAVYLQYKWCLFLTSSLQLLASRRHLVVKKDANLDRHQDIPVGNLKVMVMCKSLKSKGLLVEKFNWQWYYFNLNEEGIRAMCEYLGLPD